MIQASPPLTLIDAPLGSGSLLVVAKQSWSSGIKLSTALLSLSEPELAYVIADLHTFQLLSVYCSKTQVPIRVSMLFSRSFFIRLKLINDILLRFKAKNQPD